MCGEHLPPMPLMLPTMGSSPHVRGALVFVSLPVAGVGDHPRMCGEHQLCERPHVQQLGIIPACAGSTSRMASPAVYSVGSSPHVRGALNAARAEIQARGIIPACAGSTRRRRTARRPSWDHPRMCGEHTMPLRCPAFKVGSSPHVRGAHGHEVRVVSDMGIIPACAGSTISRSFQRRHPRDHPRMCGEHAKVPRVSRLQ